MPRILFAFVLAAGILPPALLRAADPVFSGPQPGEKTTGFKVIDIGGPSDGAERDPVRDNAGAPTALVFVHGIERSLLPLLRVIEEYGAARPSLVKTEMVFLAGDRTAGEQRVRAANGSLKLKSRVGFSPDGAEGPGNYGLNKDCLMTVVLAKDNIVTANFALVQPGIADAPGIVAALAKTCGDPKPPTVEELTARQPSMAPARTRAAAPPGGKPQDPVPGAVPTDAKLNGLLREFIRPTNDDATIDRVLAAVKQHIEGNPDLKKQAADGWTRMLHFGDHYGTPYSRKVGREFLESLKTP